MKGIAEAVENKDKKLGQKIMEKYNVKRFTGYLKNTVYNIGLEIGEGEKFLVDTDLQKYGFKETSKYIQKDLGDKEYEELINKVDIDKALPKQINKDYEIYSLLAKLHNCSTREKITDPKIDEQER